MLRGKFINSPFWLTLCRVLYILLYHLWWLSSSTSYIIKLKCIISPKLSIKILTIIPILTRLAFLALLLDLFPQFSYDLHLPFSLVVRFRSPVHSGIRFSLNKLKNKAKIENKIIEQKFSIHWDEIMSQNNDKI